MISLVAGALAYAGPAHRCAPPSPRRAVLRDHAQIVAALGRQAPEQSAQREALARLLAGAGLPDDGAITELSAGFCNWVYRVDYPAPTGSVVAKLFSPLARLRLSPAMRGMGDARAAAEGLGPRLHYLSTEGLVVDFVQGAELTEGDIHADAALRPRLLGTIASHLAQLHSLRLPHTRMPAAGAAGSAAALASAAVARHEADAATSAEAAAGGGGGSGGGGGGGEAAEAVALWAFIRKMLAHIRSAPESAVASAGIPLAAVEAEVARMRERFGELQLPVVLGHGDLKPSNVMAGADAPPPGADEAVSFIDFELAGAHYRGYDLYKLFRTSGELSQPNLRAFLRAYLDEVRGACDLSDDGGASRELELDEVQAETYAAEPLTWLEAAVFFLFAIRQFPDEAPTWAPLAAQRWERCAASPRPRRGPAPRPRPRRARGPSSLPNDEQR